jgi:hypothetical protein
LAIAAALRQTWAAFFALGLSEARDIFLGHLLTTLLDYGPGFFSGLLIWVACHRFGVRGAKFSVIVGLATFYVAPRLYALLFLQGPHSIPVDMTILFTPRLGELVIGAVLAIVMWVIGYWKPTFAARIVTEG